MKFDRTFILTILVLATFAGCSRIHETAKSIWGSSTKALEGARYQSDSKDYNCDIYYCFDAVVNIAQDRGLEIFIKDRIHDRIVLMGLSGGVETTEVGVFFSSLGGDRTKIEVASLSPIVQETASDIIFIELEKLFPSTK